MTFREINDAKKSLINSKIYSLIGRTDLLKINSWENIKGKSLWVNATFNDQEEIDNSNPLCFSFMTSSLNYLLNFSINLIDDKNKPINFTSGENKITILNFKMDVFLK